MPYQQCSGKWWRVEKLVRIVIPSLSLSFAKHSHFITVHSALHFEEQGARGDAGDECDGGDEGDGEPCEQHQDRPMHLALNHNTWPARFLRFRGDMKR